MSEPARVLKEVSLPRQNSKTYSRPVRRKSVNLSNSKVPYLVLILLLAYLSFSFSTQFNRLSNMQRDVQSIQQEVQELKEKNTNLRQELQAVQSDAYIEKTAREKLGLVKPGETRVLTVEPGTELPTLQVPTGTAPPGD